MMDMRVVLNRFWNHSLVREIDESEPNNNAVNVKQFHFLKLLFGENEGERKTGENEGENYYSISQ